MSAHPFEGSGERRPDEIDLGDGRVIVLRRPADAGPWQTAGPPPGPMPPPRGPQPPPGPRWQWIVFLFCATVVSTFLAAGIGPDGIAWKEGLLYSGGIMTILLCHELGHFLQARRHHVPASMPIFLPMPISLFGTLGALIVMRPRTARTREMFDIAISGPLAGLVPTFLCLLIGLPQSTLVPTPEGPDPSGITLGEPIAIQWLVRAFFEIPEGHTLMLGPLAFAGWVGLLITALNLLPIAQLDGGHIMYTLARKRAFEISAVIVLAAALGMIVTGYWAWTVMLVLLLVFGIRHPPLALPLSLALLAAPLLPSTLTASPAAPPPAAPLAPTAGYYLPPGVDYDPTIPLPSALLGFEVGEWHVRHDQLVGYYQELDRLSERMKLEEIGRTYERRPLLNLYVSSPRNLARLEEILAEHRRLSDAPADAAAPGSKAPELDLGKMPLVVYLGYSIHGNESSGSNAALLVAYHLAAARGQAIDELLENTLVVLDPSFNPDGLARFAQWANQNRGRVPVADPRHREHVEPWPNGRTNHYYFDLNRDWLLAAHPESRARLKQFHRLRPNLLADYHEMGTDSTFFFQPGVPSRQNPLTPASNLELTRRIAEFHARALDRIGSLYFTEENFDDFYFGKGSTYPDIQGAVGILFEQASSRGHVQESPGGLVTFPFTIRNQFTASLSMLEAAKSLRRELLEQQRTFYRDAAADAAADPRQAIVFGDPDDPRRAFGLAQLLRRHRVEVYQLKEEVEAGGVRYRPGSSYLVPIRQQQYRLIRGLFEKPTAFPDETFYDVSAWTLPLAFALPHADLGAKAWKTSLQGPAIATADELEAPAGTFEQAPDALAYVFSWHGHFAARALYRLESRGILARAATKDFGFPKGAAKEGEQKELRDLGRGSIVVPVAGQPLGREELERLLATLAAEEGIDIYAMKGGLTPSGIDIGSPSLQLLRKPRPAIVVGQPYDVSEAGEVWYLLDERFGIETTLLERRDLARADLARYSHLIFVSAMGSADLQKNELEAVKTFIRGGGTLVASGTASLWAEEQILRPPPENGSPNGPGAGPKPDGEKKPPLPRKPYGDYEKDSAHDLVAGAIFEVDLDLTHPLAYGYTNPKLPVFRVHQETLPVPPDPYTRVAVYTAEPRLAGFASADNLKKIAGSPAVAAEKLGRGTVIRYLDNPNFRGYWWGGSKLFLNGLFFSGLIEDTRDR